MSAEPTLDDVQLLTWNQPEQVAIEQAPTPKERNFQEHLEIPRPIEATLELLRRHRKEQESSNDTNNYPIWPTTHYLLRDEQDEYQLYDASLNEISQQASLETLSTTNDPELRHMLMTELQLTPLQGEDQTQGPLASIAETLHEHGVALQNNPIEDEPLNLYVLGDNGVDVSETTLPPIPLPTKESVNEESTEEKLTNPESKETGPQIWNGRALLLRTKDGLGMYFKEGVDDLPDELVEAFIARISQLEERGETIEDLILEFGLKSQEDFITDPEEIKRRQTMLEQLEQQGQAELTFQPNGSDEAWKTSYELHGILVSYEQSPIEKLELVANDDGYE